LFGGPNEVRIFVFTNVPPFEKTSTGYQASLTTFYSLPEAWLSGHFFANTVERFSPYHQRIFF
jgi:hypothetical protein